MNIIIAKALPRLATVLITPFEWSIEAKETPLKGPNLSQEEVKVAPESNLPPRIAPKQPEANVEGGKGGPRTANVPGGTTGPMPKTMPQKMGKAPESVGPDPNALFADRDLAFDDSIRQHADFVKISQEALEIVQCEAEARGVAPTNGFADSLKSEWHDRAHEIVEQLKSSEKLKPQEIEKLNNDRTVISRDFHKLYAKLQMDTGPETWLETFGSKQ